MMNLTSLPWLELSLLLSLVGAVVAAFIKMPGLALRTCLGFLLAILLCATAASLTGHSVVVMLRFYRQVTEADREAAVAKAALATL